MEVDLVEWVKNALGLAHYYANIADKLYQGAYCLAACTHVVEHARKALSEEEQQDKDHAVNMARADVLKARGKLYVSVLQQAHEHREIHENLAQMEPADERERQAKLVAQAEADLSAQLQKEVGGCIKFSTLEAGKALAPIDAATLSGV